MNVDLTSGEYDVPDLFYKLEDVFNLYKKDFPDNPYFSKVLEVYPSQSDDELTEYSYIFKNRNVANYETQTDKTYNVFINRKGLVDDENGGIPFPLAGEYIDFCDSLVTHVTTMVTLDGEGQLEVHKFYDIFEKGVDGSLEHISQEIPKIGYYDANVIMDKTITDEWFKDLL
jgi:hypothetical protein